MIKYIKTIDTNLIKTVVRSYIKGDDQLYQLDIPKLSCQEFVEAIEKLLATKCTKVYDELPQGYIEHGEPFSRKKIKLFHIFPEVEAYDEDEDEDITEEEYYLDRKYALSRELLQKRLGGAVMLGVDERGKITEAAIDTVFDSDGKLDILVSGTGTGKTFGTINGAKRRGEKVAFAVPSVALTTQVGEEYGITAYCEGTRINTANALPSVFVSTYDKIANATSSPVFGEYTLVIDEAHQMCLDEDFRGRTMYKLNKMAESFKRVIYVTATREVFAGKKFDNEFVVQGLPEHIKYNYRPVLANGKKKEAVKELISMNPQCEKWLIFSNKSKKENKALSEMLNNSVHLNSETKVTKHHKHFVEKGSYPKGVEIVVCTDLFSAGLNLNDTFKTVGVVFLDKTNPSTVKQLVARFRKTQTVDVFFTYTNDKQVRAIYNPLEDLEKAFNKQNKINEDGGALYEQDKKFDRVDDIFIRTEENKVEYIEMAVRREAYRKYTTDCTMAQLMELFPEDNVTMYQPINLKHLLDEEQEEEVEENEFLETDEARAERLHEEFMSFVENRADSKKPLKLSPDVDEKLKELYYQGFPHEVGIYIACEKETKDSLKYRAILEALNSGIKMNKEISVNKLVYDLTVRKQPGDVINLADNDDMLGVRKGSTKKVMEALLNVKEFKDGRKTMYKVISGKPLGNATKSTLEWLKDNRIKLGSK
ncbi:MAG: DEAD/DEAH box helicase family protein [Cetobacterium sp.]|uniref:DEAD/DEAH box helicase family protein n=1 Tax=Cetobacterium sp. TaxID=2071632 RepID=UPI003EE5A433